MKRKKMKKYDVGFGVRLSKDQMNDLTILALKHKKDCSEIVRACIDCMLKNNDCIVRRIIP